MMASAQTKLLVIHPSRSAHSARASDVGFVFSFPVPSELWPVAEKAREEFQSRLSSEQEPVGDTLSALECAAEFLQFLSSTGFHKKISHDATCVGLDFFAFTLVAFSQFESQFCGSNNIHVAVRSLSFVSQKIKVLRGYYDCLEYIQKTRPTISLALRSHAQRPALLQAVSSNKASLYVIFGGQGNQEAYFDELIQLYQVYYPMTKKYFHLVSHLLSTLSKSADAKAFNAHPIDLMVWLESPSTRPGLNLLLDPDVSMPLIAAIQLLNYWTSCKLLECEPGMLLSYIQGTTGHSQGIISSIVMAASKTEKEFMENTKKAIELLYFIGLQSRHAFPATTLSPHILQDSLEFNEGLPTPMLAINGLPVKQVEKHIQDTNAHLPASAHIYISLINGPRAVVCSGSPQSLYGLNVTLRKIKAQSNQDQTRIPFSQRKIKFVTRFLPIKVPFHSPYLDPVWENIQSKLGSDYWSCKDLHLAVYDTQTGLDLRQYSHDFMDHLVKQITTYPVNWPKATSLLTTHVLDMGPGGVSGMGHLTFRNKEGMGCQVILMSSLDGSPDLLDKSYLFDTRPESIQYAPHWAKEYQPRLVRIKGTDQVHVDTKMSRLLGKPPLMVAGMTPCTVDERFVSAVMNAGYHVELAGGGQHTEMHLRHRIDEIMKRVPPGEGITLNILFLNPRLWGFQYPACMAMRREGIPIEGICVAAGVPSLDVADEILKNLKSAGIRHVSFKPGSVEAIRRVITIAKQNPDMPVMLQWTGGRGGGHHSFEDMFQPLLETYGSIRKVPNISIVVGSGFGDAQETLYFLTGEWSTQFDYAPMPVDGVLFGSRVMVAKEALTSQAVKELIVATPGITNEADWEKTYKGQAGGIITVKSELGEPIHKIANRGMLFWREIDDTILSLPKDKQLKELLSKKDYIIKRLNQDYQKVWFGQKQDSTPCDLMDMTYAQVANRLFTLLYLPLQQEWIDVTLRDVFGDFLRRIEERFTRQHEISLLQSYDDLDKDTHITLTAYLENYPDCHLQTLTQEDVYYFLAICSYPYRKPVPFIPILDERFEFWFKKDSLWQADRLEAVVDQDAQRVAILQGPVAVRHSTIVNEPIKDILGNIYKEHIQEIRQRYYDDCPEQIPVVEYLAETHDRPTAQEQTLRGVSRTMLNEGDGISIMYELARKESDLPDPSTYLNMLAGEHTSWLRALLCSDAIVQNKILVQNPIQTVLRPRPCQTVLMKQSAKGEPLVLTIHDQSSHDSQIPSRHPAVIISIGPDHIITFEVFEKSRHYVSLKLYFKYKQHQGYNPIHEIMEGRHQRIKEFYAKLWDIDISCLKSSTSLLDPFTSEFTVQEQQVREFVRVIDNNAQAYLVKDRQGRIEAPMDFAIVAGWKSLAMTLLLDHIDGDLLKLVHLSNEFRVLSEDKFYPGDQVVCEAIIDSVVITDSGKVVQVKETLAKKGMNRPILQLVSQFLYRGKHDDFETTFKRTSNVPMLVKLNSLKDVAVLKSKEWIQWDPLVAYELVPGSHVVFKLDVFHYYENSQILTRLQVHGDVFVRTNKETIRVGRIDYQCDRCFGNVVMEYLNRHGSQMDEQVLFSNQGYSVLPQEKIYPAHVMAPTTNKDYSLISGDFNPIHTNPYFADLAGLPGTITHGMWTSASTRKFVEIFAANNQPHRVKSYSVKFIDMVLPGEQLSTRLFHIGMSKGRRLIKVETVNSLGNKVLEGTAEVEQQSTAYVFTGQGSQEVGMGMDLYKTSAIAKEIWDRADAHMLQEYGVSLLEIVQLNPKTKTIYFGGKQGAAIRKNYMSMTYDIVEEGQLKSLPLFPHITHKTPFYTFTHPSGLLSATQFTQPALTLMEMAQFQDMKANGIVQEQCPFAGHSLGEYAALAAVGHVLTVEGLVDVVFYRGMTMQVAVPRDEQGRSNYGMCAVNPLRVGSTFGEQGLAFVIQAISNYSPGLIEIVNFNVENFQYVVAGELRSLDILRLVLNKIHSMNLNFKELVKTKTMEEIERVLRDIVSEAVAVSQAKSGILVQERGIASIPLLGIDVPFHSSFLKNGVGPFREVLRKKLEARFINVSLLIGKYIPNLTATPFALTLDYVQMIYQQTHSEILAPLISSWDATDYTDPSALQQLGYTLLIELLAYQFASPVRWAETQDQLFGEYHIERLVEVGPAPILCGMATRTLKIKYEKHDDAVTQHRVQLCTCKDKKEIYYEFEDVVEEPKESSETVVESPIAPPAVTVQPMAPTPQAPAEKIADINPTASDILMALIAKKLKKSVSDIPNTKTIKELVNGKSTLQNEILGDLAAEFGNVVQDKAEEMPLKEVAQSLETGFSGSLGKISSGLINKMIASKMPGGFTLSKIKSYLSTKYGLGPKRSDSVLLLGLTQEPASRLGDEGQACQWLEAVAQSYANQAGITFTSTPASSSSHSQAVAINNEHFDAFKTKFNKLLFSQIREISKYLDMDMLQDAHLLMVEKAAKNQLQKQLDLWMEEHGEIYADGIQPMFSMEKARIYDSYWNWVRQDALQLYYDLIFGRISTLNRDLVNKCNHLVNRTHDYEAMSEFMEYYLDNWPNKQDDKYANVRELTRVLADSVREAVDAEPVFKHVMYQSHAPKTYAAEDGSIQYKEIPRASMNMKGYVEELKKGSPLTVIEQTDILQSFADIEKLVVDQGDTKLSAKLNKVLSQMKSAHRSTMPFVSMKSRKGADMLEWKYDSEFTRQYLDILSHIATDGVSFKGKHVLMTGAGRGSIGIEIVQMLLSGGANVIVTTASFSPAGTRFYREVYEKYGAKGSRLVVVPFNGCSTIDITALVDYIYDSDNKKGLGWDLDIIIPFAAFPQNGREIDGIDSKSELALRLMLTNVFRLMGQVKLKKQQHGFDTRPATVLLPLSPNHGTFGGDGLYSESKIALETLMNRFKSENWSSYLTIIGAVIGWTRGTGLMSANNIVAEGIEKLGARTFSQLETAFNIIGLLHPDMIEKSQTEPVWADLNGGLQFVKDLNTVVFDLRREILENADIKKSVAKEKQIDMSIIKGLKSKSLVQVQPRANIQFSFPPLAHQKSTHLRGMLDLEKVVVLTGFGEVGPWGSSRTRWEMESFGEFSLEGCIEMAWMMGFIQFHNGKLKNIPHYSGWIDTATLEPVQDAQVKTKYESKILEHSGIRLIESEKFNGYDPKKKLFLQEVVVVDDMPPIEVSQEDAEAFQLQHGPNVAIEKKEGRWFVYVKKGATLHIPKALRFDRWVAGQIPTGWSAARYGVPEDIIQQVDPVTLYVLVSTVEALVTSGVTDPYEFYQYVHVSQVGNTAGGGMGGMRAMQRIFKERMLEKSVQNDILQESFINTMPAWVNMLLLSSSGPIKTPVGACATAAESVDIALDTILSGKAKVVICGGYDDFQEEGSFEFANMKATSNAVEEFAKGREPAEMCRPASDTRAGFMEAQGAGIHVLMSADLAINMGVPIRGIIACANTATDKQGRSVPAPGQGILTTARESRGSNMSSLLLNLDYRRKQLTKERNAIQQWIKEEYQELQEQVEELKQSGLAVDDSFVRERSELIEKQGQEKERAALSLWSHDFWKKDPTISPLRGALATFGLTVDDIGLASFHGTGTKANDYNESSAVNQQMQHLGRTLGNIIPCVFQKHLTGHPKGAAAAWMLNGVVQCLETGIIPGNRNCDNVDARLEQFKYLLYPSTSIQTDGIKAALLKSFGFGQAGAEVLVIHPDYLFAALNESDFNDYVKKRKERQVKSYRYFHETLTGKTPFVQVKTSAPYTDQQQSQVYLNPLVRASFDKYAGTWNFRQGQMAEINSETHQVTQALIEATSHLQPSGIGLDVQLISEVNCDNPEFIKRNFTASEIEYCQSQPSPRCSFAGRWAAKEAVIKAVSNLKLNDKIPVWTGSAASPLKEIEILRRQGEAPEVVFHGDAKRIVSSSGVQSVNITISHSGSYAVAVAVAKE